MKRSLFLPAFLAATVCLKAQNISFSYKADSIAAVAPGYDAVVHGTFINHTSSVRNIRLIIKDLNLSSGWNYSTCLIPYFCAFSPDTIDFQLNANDTSEVEVTFITNSVPDTSSFHILFQNLDNPGEELEYSFYGITDSMYTGIVTADMAPSAVALLFPNPATDHVMISLNYEASAAAPVFLFLYDLQGNLVRSERIAVPEEILWRESLARGAYFYEIRSAEGRIGAGKLVLE